jgi:hypothetical protein
MIVIGIPFKIWEKVIRYFCILFFIILSISPLLFLFKDILLPSAYEMDKATGGKTLSKKSFSLSFLDKNLPPTLPSPDISSYLSYLSFNNRPDNKESFPPILLSSTDNRIQISLNERVYLRSKDLNHIEFTSATTPYFITPIAVNETGLTLKYECLYKNKEGAELYHRSDLVFLPKSEPSFGSLDPFSEESLKSLNSAKFYPPDKLISLLGGKEFSPSKDLSRLFFPLNKEKGMLPLKEGDQCSFSGGNWIKNPKDSRNAPLFIVSSMKNNEISGTFWSSNGFYSQKINIPLQKSLNTSYQTFAFDSLYKRNNETVICKSEGKTYILKENDWLVKNPLSWAQLQGISEFNDLMDYKIFKEILVFDCIEKEEEDEVFIGYIFDESRSNFKKLQIPLKKNTPLRYSK